METFLRILRDRRITQLQLAVAAGMSPYRLSRLVNKHSKPRLSERRRIAHALGLSVADVFGPRRRRPRVRAGLCRTHGSGAKKERADAGRATPAGETHTSSPK